MHEKIKGAEFTLIPGGSHATPAENPEMVNIRIDLWLRTHFNELVAEQMTAPRPALMKAASKKAKRSV